MAVREELLEELLKDYKNAYSAPLRPPNPENFGHLIRKTSATPVG